jgi:hypothetical protein
MSALVNAENVVTALAIGVIFALVKLFWDVQQLRIQAEPLLEWWKKTSIDALKIATNPTSERLAELADRYIAGVKGDRSKLPLNVSEKQELIDGLREVMNDKKQFEAKRQSASMSLRFIESREGLSSKTANSNH